ncbi:MAG: sulfocyanin-like copper-binding protein, partial [Candidatus Parvarchaeum sp.]
WHILLYLSYTRARGIRDVWKNRGSVMENSKNNNAMLFAIIIVIAVIVIVIVFLTVNHTISFAGPVSVSVSTALSTVPAGVTVNAAANTIYINKSTTIAMGMIDNLSSDPANNITLNSTIPGTSTPYKALLGELDLQALPAFMVYGLINPTIIIKQGSVVTFNAFDLSDYAYHGYMIANDSFAPPYTIDGPESAFDGYTGANDIVVKGILIPPPKNGRIYEESQTFDASVNGVYWYLCPVFGHAALGMYGKIVVSGSASASTGSSNGYS